jgi:hypothetical protein
MRQLNINDADYPVLPRYSAIKMFCDKKGIDFFEFPELLIGYGIGKKDFKPTSKFIDDMTLLTFCFLERGAEAANTKLTLSENDILDWFMDGHIVEVYDLIIEAQGQSKNPASPQEKGAQS